MRKNTLFLQILLLCYLNNSFGKLIYQQSDRIHIQSDQIYALIEKDKYLDMDIIFPKEFKNIPQVLYSYQGFEKSEIIHFSFQISTLSVTKTELSYRVSNTGITSIIFLRIQVLAIDDPSIQIVNETIQFEADETKIIQFNGVSKIQSFTAFICGYQSKTNQPYLRLQYDQIDDKTYNLKATNLSIQKAHLNYLVIYDNINDNEYSSLYSYKQVIDKRYANVFVGVPTTWTEDTLLSDGSQVLFGFWGGSLQNCKGFRICASRNQLVQSNKVNIEYANICGNLFMGQQVQFMVQNCEIGECLYLNRQTNINECRKMELQNNINAAIKTLYTMQIFICTQCNENCLKCKGQEIDKCLACLNGKYLNPFSEKCEDQQPSETYCVQETVDGNTFYNCRQCHASCESCQDGNYNGCTKCKKTNALPVQYLLNGQCFPYQPVNTFCGLKKKRILTNQ